ncbi:MAG: hypothetical protein J5694_00620 [Erysipelotrichaceae bacterium]|nr:hypothetical protein [Erysipelotrichaceae bacterium]
MVDTSEFSVASKAAGSGIDRLNAFTEELNDWSVSGKKPILASRELRYVLTQQRKRLQGFGLQMENRIDHTAEEINGKLVRKGESINASVIYREAVRRLTIRQGDRTVREEKEPIVFYATLLEKEGFSDFSCTCPNCGHTGLVSDMRDGCPYCGTVFEIEDVWPVFTSWYSVPGIVERSTLLPNLKKYLTIIFVCATAVLSIVSWFSNVDVPAILRILVSLFTGAVAGGMLTITCYFLYSIYLLVRAFKEAGRALPLLKGIKTGDKVEKIIRQYEPDFSYPYFEGRLISLLRAIAFTDKRSELSIYEGNEDLSFLDSLIDMQYRGVLQLLSSSVEDGVIHLKLKAFMDNCRYDGSVRRRDENYIVCVEKDIDAHTDPQFSLCNVKCRNCGSSFDALHMQKCPYCGSPYKLIHDDWMITSIQKK